MTIVVLYLSQFDVPSIESAYLCSSVI